MRTYLLSAIVLCVLMSVSAFAQDGKLADPATRPDLSFPPVDGCAVLVGDFHMHTVRSDGSLTTKQRVLESYRFGYDVIAIADHGQLRGYRTAKPLTDALGMVLVRGLETGFGFGEHVVAVGVSDQYTPRSAHHWADEPGQKAVYFKDELTTIADCGGVCLYAHPHKGFREQMHWAIEQGMMVGVEVENTLVGDGWEAQQSHGTNCYPNAFEWALANNLTVFANTDVHGHRVPDSARTLVLVKDRSPEGVVDAIRNRRTIAWFTGMLWAREELLSALVRDAVKVRPLMSATDGFYAIRNDTPVALKASLQGDDSEALAVEIPARSEVLVRQSAPVDTLRITWTNLWVTPTENLVTTHGASTTSSAAQLSTHRAF